MTFDSLGLDPLILKAIKAKGYTTPSPIQAKAIPSVLKGLDVMAAAQTGTGKTAGFTLPLLQGLLNNKSQLNPRSTSQHSGNQARALVLTPTRELAAQVAESIATYGQFLKLKSCVVFGGVKINPQMQKLRGGCDILIATPGRLLDLYQQNAIRFQDLEVLVLDEADRMLDMGFIRDIKKIIAFLPKKRQSLLFSATFSNDIRQLAQSFTKDPVEISVSPRNTTAQSVKQVIHPVDKAQKAQLLAHLIQTNAWEQVLVFSRTKHGANKLVKILESNNITASAIHGNKSQNARTKALAEFKSGGFRILVATDIAARGLDINQLPHVINFDLPNVPEDYVHRIGRTGRAGAEGEAISLVAADECDLLFEIERLIQKLIPREYIQEFVPKHEVPASRLRAPKKAPRPKKQSGGAQSPEARNANPRNANPRRNNPRKPSGNR